MPLRLITTIALLLAASAVSAEFREEHGFVFDMKRTYFINPDWGSEEHAVQAPFADGDLSAHGYILEGRDYETGHEYVARTSVVNIIPDENGDLRVREGIRVPAPEGEGTAFMAAEDISIPVVTEPSLVPNVLFGRHPLALVLDEYRELMELPAMTGRGESAFGLREDHIDNHWHYMFFRSLENGQVERVALFDRNTGGLFLRAHFSDWHEAPSGRMIPGTAILRTFKGDQDRPVVEVHVTNFEELPLDAGEGGMLEEVGEEAYPDDPLIRYRPGPEEAEEEGEAPEE